MKPVLVSEERLEQLWVMEGRQRRGNEAQSSFERGNDDWSAYLAGARAVLAELNIQAVAEIPATRCSDHEKRVYCQYSDWDTGCELCRALPEKGALLVRQKIT